MYIYVLLDSDATFYVVQYYIVVYNTRIVVQDLKKTREYSEFYLFVEAVILHRSLRYSDPIDILLKNK